MCFILNFSLSNLLRVEIQVAGYRVAGTISSKIRKTNERNNFSTVIS